MRLRGIERKLCKARGQRNVNGREKVGYSDPELPNLSTTQQQEQMYKYFFGFLTLIFIAFACNPDDNFITDSGAKLEFSLDTLRFDTVFTELGSATRTIKVFNRNNRPVSISRISVQDPNTKFRFNIDGVPGNEAQDVEIAANDSLYIFGEVTINPDDPLSLSPYIVEDALLFETNGNEQVVYLEAFGQNANYIPNRFAQNQFALLSCDFGDEFWTDTLPYVIYGVLFINECTLHIPAGAEIYVHGGIARQIDPATDESLIYNSGLIYVDSMGHVEIDGTLERPVTIQGDRLESPFAEVSGQWVGIYMRSPDNKISHTTIKNAQFGVRVDPNASLEIDNSQIYNMSSAGLVGVAADIDAENCLIYNTGSFNAQMILGGNYSFDYCTMASYGVDASAVSISNGLCLDQFCEEALTNDLQADFRNCIIYGSRQDEIVLEDFTRRGDNVTDLDYRFENCIVRVQDLIDENEPGSYPDFFDNCNPCNNAAPSDALFVDPNDDNYFLDTLSIAEGQAQVISTIDTDLEGNERDAETPDIGVYEYQE